MLERWISEIKEKDRAGETGMILIHHGTVRATSKNGSRVSGMELSCDRKLLEALLEEARGREGITDVRVWINEGNLKVGDDIMYVLVAGRFRKDVFPVLDELVRSIKEKVVREKEYV